MKEIEFTFGCGFGGRGGGAVGALRAEAHLLGVRAHFKHTGSFDKDERACADYRYLTGHEQTCIDARELTPAVVRAVYGDTAPDMMLLSAPCQGASALLSEAKAATPHYQELNELAVIWTRVMLEAWNPGPRLVLFENVPRITARAKPVIDEVKRLLRERGYVLHDGAHELGSYAPGGHYDAGVLGGLAQHRQRWLLIARDPKRCAPLVYKPVQRRVRAVGEVIGPLPMPGDPDGGPMHVLPKLSPMNWLRLAMIPAGGDWRDIPGDIKVDFAFGHAHKVTPWESPSGTVTHSPSPASGAIAVADPRVPCEPRAGAYGVVSWADSASTVTSSLQIDNGRAAVADPRVQAFRDGYGVIPWSEPSGTITGDARPSKGDFAVADPRPSNAFDRGYSVIPWDSAANTIASNSAVGCGAYSVADPRERGAGAWLTLDDAKKFLVGPGPWAIVDRASDGPPIAVIRDLRKPSPIPILIVAEDGTWHRPLTVLELAVLQGLPPIHNGAPLQLAGPATADREGIGSMIPPPAMCAIAEQCLIALLQHELGAFALSGGGAVWVDGDEAEEALAS